MLARECFSESGHYRIFSKTFDSSDYRPTAVPGMGDARTRGSAVELNGAGSANPMLAAHMSAGQQEMAAQHVDELLARLDLEFDGISIDDQRDLDAVHGVTTAFTA